MTSNEDRWGELAEADYATVVEAEEEADTEAIAHGHAFRSDEWFVTFFTAYEFLTSEAQR